MFAGEKAKSADQYKFFLDENALADKIKGDAFLKTQTLNLVEQSNMQQEINDLADKIAANSNKADELQNKISGLQQKLSSTKSSEKHQKKSE